MTDSPAFPNNDTSRTEDTKALTQAVEELRKRCDSLERIRYAVGAVLFAAGVALIIVFGIDPKNIAKEVAKKEATDTASKEVENTVARIVPQRVDDAVKHNVQLQVPGAVSSQVAIELRRVLRDETLKPTLDAIEGFKSIAFGSAANAERDAQLIKQRLNDLKLQSREKDDILREISRRSVMYVSKPAALHDFGLPKKSQFSADPEFELSVPCKKGDRVFVLGYPLTAEPDEPHPVDIYGRVGLSGKGKEISASTPSRYPGAVPVANRAYTLLTNGSAWCIAEAVEDGDLKFSALWKGDDSAPWKDNEKVKILVGGSLVGWIIGPALSTQ